MKRRLLVSISFVVTLLTIGFAATDETEKPGLAIGQRAPSFTLKDQNGKDVALESLLKKGPVAVVFHRSADWCLYCKLQMVELQRNLQEIEGAGAQIVGISFDSEEILRRFARKNKIDFPLLADPGSKIIDAYQIRNPDVPARVNGVAYHATFIVDQKGIIRSKLYGVSYQERSALEELLTTLKDARESNTAGTRNEVLTNVVTTGKTK